VNPALRGLGAVYYAWRERLPLVASFHTNVPAYARHYGLKALEPVLWWYFRTLHNRADINLATSRAMLDELSRHGFERLDLWDRGVDVELFSDKRRSARMRARLAGEDGFNGHILLYVGRLAAEKGIERLRPCLDLRPDIRLAIVGDGPHRAQLERVFAGTRTVFTGYLHGEELAEAYASADGFVFPSTTETLGLVLFEAMASGLPVMAADSPPTREVLENGAAGILFDPTDTLSIMSALDQLFEPDGPRERIRQRGREIVAALDWRGPTRQLLEHYERVLAASGLVQAASHASR
jgi:glycosyltransferase involved in cell wall biosynthesis